MARQKNKAYLAFEARLGYTFKNFQHLERAFTHRSFCAEHNERLEFLGDAVLNLAVTETLFRHLTHHNEGELSRLRAELVRRDTLHQIAHHLDISPLLRLSTGERQSGGETRASILADTIEALIGAVFLDGGFEAAQALVDRLLSHADLQNLIAKTDKDAKTQLQEYLQAKRLPLPLYQVVHIAGEEHRQTFEVSCTVTDTALTPTTGKGPSRKAAEQAAAAIMLEQLTSNT